MRFGKNAEQQKKCNLQRYTLYFEINYTEANEVLESISGTLTIEYTL